MRMKAGDHVEDHYIFTQAQGIVERHLMCGGREVKGDRQTLDSQVS
ncbi:MAG: hypothetical protein JWM91_4464 [Rhodospirillales bacterium]|nr:hypothetical protein [Rhodospirillales bacterium]